MKRKLTMTRVIWGVLFLALVAYLLVALLTRGSRDAATVPAVRYTVENACTVQGILVRDEAPMRSDAAFVDVRPADGEKVGVGQTLAITCQDEEQLTLLRRMDELEASIAQLSALLEQDISPSRAVEMDRDIVDAVTDIAALRASGDLFGATGQVAEIKSLVVARTALSSSQTDAERTLRSMQDEYTSITAQLRGSSRIASTASGTFASSVDGYENEVTPADLSRLTVEGLEDLLSGGRTAADGSFGKFVTGITWYYAALIDREEARGFRAGDTVRMRFLNGCGGDLDMHVERVGEAEGGDRCVLILSCDTAMADTIGLRVQPAEIINSSVQGIRVPKNALRVSESGQTGVYCVNGNTAVFRAADVIWDLEDYVLVEENTRDSEHLRAGEKIIVGELDLYEGKVVIGS